MTFENILDQAIAMLQRRGRLTYRTLKRQFDLDDAALEDLKIELIEGQQLTTDEHGTVLVWSGSAGPAAAVRGLTRFSAGCRRGLRDCMASCTATAMLRISISQQPTTVRSRYHEPA